MEWTDSAAAREARRGNQQAFRVLVERHSRAVFRLAFRMTGNQQDAEDTAQETFLRAYKQLHRFDGRAAFGTWLYRICANCSLDLLHRRKSRKELSVSGESESMTHWLNSIAAPGPSPERMSQNNQIADSLNDALGLLTENERAAFLLRHYEGCGIQEIAASLDIGVSATKHSIFRAVQKLRRVLEPIRGVTAQ